MVEAEVVDTATETNGYTHSEPIPDKLTTVGEEKKVSTNALNLDVGWSSYAKGQKTDQKWEKLIFKE